MPTKVCSKCELELGIECFTKNKARPDGLNGYCRSCHNKYTASHYRNNKEYYVKKALKNTSVTKEFVRSKKDVPCTDCKQSYPWYVMDFDHLQDKKFTIGASFGVSRKSLLEEIDKCEVVCSNCHRERTYQRQQNAPLV